MLIAVLAFGGAILSATTVAGLLMLYQIRATTDSENSAKAIFAADAGTDWALFDFYCDASNRCVGAREQPKDHNPLGNGASFNVLCYNSSGGQVACSATTTAISAIADGTYTSAKRAFYLGLVGATGTIP